MMPKSARKLMGVEQRGRGTNMVPKARQISSEGRREVVVRKADDNKLVGDDK